MKTNSVKFQLRAWIGTENYSVEVWVHELKPFLHGCDRYAEDWVLEFFSLYAREDLLERFDLQEGKQYQLLFTGKLHANEDHNGEWDEDLEVLDHEVREWPGPMPWEDLRLQLDSVELEDQQRQIAKFSPPIEQE